MRRDRLVIRPRNLLHVAIATKDLLAVVIWPAMVGLATSHHDSSADMSQNGFTVVCDLMFVIGLVVANNLFNDQP